MRLDGSVILCRKRPEFSLDRIRGWAHYSHSGLAGCRRLADDLPAFSSASAASTAYLQRLWRAIPALLLARISLGSIQLQELAHAVGGAIPQIADLGIRHLMKVHIDSKETLP